MVEVDMTPVERRAMQTCLAGRQYLRERNVDGMIKAKDLFESALEQNAQLAPALSGMAECLPLLGTTPFATYDAREVFPQASDYARDALKHASIEGDMVSAKTTLAVIDMLHHWNWVAAEEGFKKMVSLRSSDTRRLGPVKVD